MRRVVTALMMLVLCGRTSSPSAQAPAQGDDPAACRDASLFEFVRTIDAACTTRICNFQKLQAVEYIDDAALFEALKRRDLRPVRLFFPQGKSAVSEAFDWETIKRRELADQMRTITRPENAVVFVLGSASSSGSVDLNLILSQERMQSVLSYLEDVMQVNCKDMKGGYFGKSLMQLTRESARELNIPTRDFRDDELILNQSVFVFAYPCAHLLPTR